MISIIGFLDDKINIDNKKRIILIITSVLLITLLSPEIFIIEKIKFSIYENDINTNYLKMFIFPMGFLILSIILNLIDGENGILLTFFIGVMILVNGINNNLAFLLLIGTSLVCLVLNLKNKIFMGSFGCNLITLIIALLILNKNNNSTILIDEIFLILILPFIDSVYLFIYRSMKNINPFKPDSDHFHNKIITNLNFVNKKNCYIFYNIYAFTPFLIYKAFNQILISLLFFIFTYILLRNRKF